MIILCKNRELLRFGEKCCIMGLLQQNEEIVKLLKAG